MFSPPSPDVLFFPQPSSLDPRPASRRGCVSRGRESGPARRRAWSIGQADSVRPGALQILDLLTEIPAVTISKMKVHPAMLMKTKKSRFQVSGVRCQDQRDCGYLPRDGCLTQGIVQNEGPSGYVDENKVKAGFRVSGARCQDQRDRGYLPRAGCLTQGICKMKVHPAMLHENKDGDKMSCLS